MTAFTEALKEAPASGTQSANLHRGAQGAHPRTPPYANPGPYERERGTERLEQAVTAFTEALKERTRERVPPTGPRLGHPGYAEQSAPSARKEITRERVPLDWAGTTLGPYELGCAGARDRAT